MRFGDQGEGSGAGHIEFQFRTRVRDAGNEALLVDLPQAIEVARTIVAQGKFHGAIVLQRFGPVRGDFGRKICGKFMKKALLGLHPES